MSDRGLHLVTFFAYASRDLFLLSRTFDPLNLRFTDLIYVLNAASYALFLFVYSFYYVDYVIENVVRRLIAPEKEQMMEFFIGNIWLASLQQLLLSLVFLWAFDGSIAAKGYKVCACTACTAVCCLASACLSFLNPASLYLSSSMQTWPVVFCCCQLALAIALLYLTWKLSERNGPGFQQKTFL